MTPRASLVVPLAGDLAGALACLEAIAAQPAEPSFEVIVVADAAPWLEPLLAQLDGDVVVVRTERPVGPAGALALALHRVGAPIVGLLAGARIAAPGWLAPLLSALEQDPAVGTAYVPPADTAPGAAAHEGPRTLPSPLDAVAAAWRTHDVRAAADALHGDRPPIPGLALALAERGLRSEARSAGAVTAPHGPVSPHPPGTAPELTVVIPTLDTTTEHMRRCVAALHACTEAPHEVVIVDNGAPAQGFSQPVNAGLRAATTPYVAVMNDDVEVLPGWWPPLRHALDTGAAVSFPLTVDGGMRADFPAWCFAASRATLERFSHEPDTFFDPALTIWFQDTDLLMRLRAAGLPPQLVSTSRIRHGLSHTLADPDPTLSAWILATTESDRTAFVAKHPDVRLTAITVGA